MRALVSGGCKMGKSTLAQAMTAVQGDRRVYVATMVPRDSEDVDRIKRHQQERAGMGFETVECPKDIGRLVGMFPPEASLLLDSTTALLAEEMFSAAGVDETAPTRVIEGLDRLLAAYPNLVVVSDSIHADGARYDEATEAYRRGLAEVDRFLATRCDAVIEMVFGQKIRHRGGEAVAAWISAADARVCDGAGAVYGVSGDESLA